MTYKIKRPVGSYYIPLSDKIERQLDNEWNAGRKGKEEMENPMSKNKRKGWYEAPDVSGKAPRHREVALRSQLSGALRTPMQKEESPYEKKANEFLRRRGIRFTAKYSSGACPMWCDGKHIHGNRHRVTFSRIGTPSKFTLMFWNSYSDKQAGKKPTAYDVLAAIQKGDLGDFEDFVSEFGYDQYEETDTGRMIVNRKTMKTYKAVVKEWEKVKAFFTEGELEELYDIA